MNLETLLHLLGTAQPPKGSGVRHQYIDHIVAYLNQDALVINAMDGYKNAIGAFPQGNGTRSTSQNMEARKPVEAARLIRGEDARLMLTALELSSFILTKPTSATEVEVTFPGTPTVPLRAPTRAELKTAVDAMKGTFSPGDFFEMAYQSSHLELFFALEADLVLLKHPNVMAVIDLVSIVSGIPLFIAKYLLDVDRPKEFDGTVQTVIPTPRHTSLPSGHATVAYALADVLSELLEADSARKARLALVAERIARNRERAGVHTALDTTAGKDLGQRLAQWLIAASNDPDAYPKWAILFSKAAKECIV